MIKNGGNQVLNLQNKKILYILSGNEPSGYVRARIFKTENEKQGLDVDFIQLKSDFLIKTMMKLKPLLLAKLTIELIIKISYNLKRFYLMRIIDNYDVIIAIKFIKSDLLKRIKSNSKALLIYDFDDSVWLNAFDGEDEFAKKVTIVDCVTSGNSYLASKAAQYNKNSYVVNAPSQIEQFMACKSCEKDYSEDKKEIIIGWIGSPSTLFSLYKIYDALEIIGEKYPNVVLKLVGTGKDSKMIPRFEKIKVRTISSYDQSEMIKQVSSFDIGLYPLFLSELSLGRGPLKATIYMAGKVPLICSGYIENNKIVEDGVNGFFANETSEWIDKLSLLIENRSLREKIGLNGFKYASEHNSINKSTNQLLEIIGKHS